MVLQDSWTETQDTEAVLQEQDFIVLAQTQQSHVQRLSLDNKVALPYITLQAGYRSKKQGLTHMWFAYKPICYFNPQCYKTFFTFRLHFISLLCNLLPPHPPLDYQNTDLLASFQALLPATLFPILMLGPT
jgi:hypothetical protein